LEVELGLIGRGRSIIQHKNLYILPSKIFFMPNLMQILESLDIQNRNNRDSDLKRIVGQAVRMALEEVPIVTSLQISKILKEYSQKGIIKQILAKRVAEFSSTENPSICVEGVHSTLLRDAVKNVLGEIVGFEVIIHYRITAGNGGTIYYKNDSDLEEYIRTHLTCRPKGALHYDFKLED